MELSVVVASLLARARSEGRNTLLEPELYDLMRAGGLDVPACAFLPLGEPSPFCPSPAGPGESGPLRLPGDRVVLKVVSPAITHKTEVGGVRIVDNTPQALADGVAGLLATVRERGGEELFRTVRGVLAVERIECESGLGGQIFVGMRFSRDMGHVLTMGFGGLEAEELSARFRQGEANVVFSPELWTPEQGLAKLARSFAGRKVMGATRGGRELVSQETLSRVLGFFTALARECSNRPALGAVIEDFEVNPFFVSGSRLVAVDGFLRFGDSLACEGSVDVAMVRRLLNPRTIAVVGASTKGMNVGRTILRKLLRDHFPLTNVRVIRPDAATLDGIDCVPDVKSLPWVADLLVVAVGAAQVPAVMADVLDSGKAASLILIPGGMGETEAGRKADQDTRNRLAQARREGRFAPVLVGPNCLGIRSLPGGYDSIFIPETKLPLPEGHVSNAALICQSGAFMITRMNELPYLSPAYSISTGNQMDLSLVDFVECLVPDAKIPILALYIEGLKELDGLRLARLIERARSLGKDVLVYKAGRTSEGATAASSHTASISGDYRSAVELFRDCGALVADTFREFTGFLSIASQLQDCTFSGKRLAILSNAGFETVGMADNIDSARGFSLPRFSAATNERIRTVLSAARLESLINVHNPLDLTPMANDRILASCLDALLADEGVDALMFGVVPATPALKTLPPGLDPLGIDTFRAPDALPGTVPEILARHNKPVAVVIDSSTPYDPLATAFHLAGIPCARSADFALAVFQKYIHYRLGRPELP